MRKTDVPAALLRRTLNRFAPGPLIVRLLLISNSPFVSVIVVRFEAGAIVVPEAASLIALRSDPAGPGAGASAVHCDRDGPGKRRRGNTGQNGYQQAK